MFIIFFWNHLLILNCFSFRFKIFLVLSFYFLLENSDLHEMILLFWLSGCKCSIRQFTPVRITSWYFPRAFKLKSIFHLDGPFPTNHLRPQYFSIFFWLRTYSWASSMSLFYPWLALSFSMAFKSWAWFNQMFCPFYLGYRLQVLFFKEILNIILIDDNTYYYYNN